MADKIVRRLIPGYESHYAGDDGGIWILKPNGWLRLRHYLAKGYPTVKIQKRSFNVHSLICRAFHGPRPDGHEVCHNDDVKTNNSPGNLRWGTRASNFEDLVRSGKCGLHVGGSHLTGKIRPGKLSNDKREAIRALKGTASQSKIAKQFGVSQGTVWKLWTNQYAAHSVTPQ